MTTNRHNIPKGWVNATSRTQPARLWNCSDRAARHTFADYRVESSNDPHNILSMLSEHAEHWQLHDPAGITTFIAKTNARASNTFLTLREAWRRFEPPNRGGQTKIDDSV